MHDTTDFISNQFLPQLLKAVIITVVITKQF